MPVELKPCSFCGSAPETNNRGTIVWCPDPDDESTERRCPIIRNAFSPEAWNFRPLENALNAEIARLLVGMGWQPIRTAPKDGTMVLVRNEAGKCHVVFWHSGYESWTLSFSDTGLDNITHWAALPQLSEAEHV
jgi:hypothetical protein